MAFPALDVVFGLTAGAIDFLVKMALTAQRYQNGHRIFDTLLKRRIYHRFRASQSSKMILICFLGKNADRILKLLVREIELS